MTSCYLFKLFSSTILTELSMEQSPRQADSYSASQEILLLLWNPKVHSKQPTDLRPRVTFCNQPCFYGEELSPRPTPKLEDNLLPPVRDYLFSIFAAILRIWRTFPPSATRGRAVPWWKDLHNEVFLPFASQILCIYESAFPV